MKQILSRKVKPDKLDPDTKMKLNVADAVVADETGSIKLTLWNEQIDQVDVGNKIKIENGYVTSFKGEIQLNVGKFGTMTVE